MGFRVRHVFSDGDDVSKNFETEFKPGNNETTLYPVLYLTGDGTGSTKETDYVADKLNVIDEPSVIQNVFTVQANTQLKEEYDQSIKTFGQPKVLVFFRY